MQFVLADIAALPAEFLGCVGRVNEGAVVIDGKTFPPRSCLVVGASWRPHTRPLVLLTTSHRKYERTISAAAGVPIELHESDRAVDGMLVRLRRIRR